MSCCSKRNNVGAFCAFQQLCIGFFVVLFAYSTSESFQTVLNGSWGYASLMTIYGMFAISSFVTPPLIKILGEQYRYFLLNMIRLTLALSSLGYGIFVFTNIFYHPLLVLIGSGIIGLAAGSLWNAQGNYLADCSVLYHIQSAVEDCTSLFNGIFYLYVKFSNAAGNFMFSYLLTYISSPRTVFIIMTCTCIPSILMFLLLPKIKFPEIPTSPSSLPPKKTSVTIKEVFLLLSKTKPIRFIIAGCFHVGISNGFSIADFTKFVVKPVLGVNGTGYIVGCFFISAGIGSYVIGKCCGNKHIGRKKMAILTAICEIASYIYMFFYKVDSNNITTFDRVFAYAYPCFFNFINVYWNSQMPSFLQMFYSGDDFKPAIAHFNIWKSVGYTLNAIIGILFPYNLYVKLSVLLTSVLVTITSILYLDCSIHSIDHPGGAEQIKVVSEDEIMNKNNKEEVTKEIEMKEIKKVKDKSAKEEETLPMLQNVDK